MIKTLLFDFGDIFINLDKLKPYTEFEKLGLAEFTEEMRKHNERYEVGEITTKEFCEFYVKHSTKKITSNEVQKAWNSMLLDFPLHRLKFIQELAGVKNFQLILLSNTNELHINWIKRNVPHYYDFKVCFDAFYLSHDIGLRKPNDNIYEFILKNHDVAPAQVLFIDDTQDNTQAAKAMGLNTWNLDPKTEDVVDLFTTNQHLF